MADVVSDLHKMALRHAKIHSECAVAFFRFKIELPLRHAATNIGSVLDAAGADVLTIDVNGERPDAEVTALAELLVSIINAKAGFLPEANHG